MKQATAGRTPQKNTFLAAAVLLLFGGVWLACLRQGVPHPALLSAGEHLVLETGWRTEGGEATVFPAFPQAGGGVRSYTLRLPSAGSGLRAPMLFFTARYVNARFYLDGQLLGESLARPAGAVSTQGKVFTLLALPPDYAGRELRLEAELLLGKSVSYELPAPIISSRSGVISIIVSRDLLPALVDLFIFCCSLILLLFGLQRGPVRHERTFLYTGLFAACFALYSLCTADLPHLLCGNSYLIYVFEFLLLALVPIPLVAAFAGQCRPSFRRLLQADLVLLFANLLLQAGLHFFTPLELRTTVFLTHGCMLVSLGVLTPALLWGWSGEGRLRTILTFAPIFLGALADLALFYGTKSFRSSFWIKIGVLLFVLLQTYGLVHDYLKHCESDLKASIYRRMAYVDSLTGLGNRAAFEQKIAELEKALPRLSTLWCLCADVNGLKQVNDTQGHAAGDQLIRAAADALRAVSCRHCSLYRTGGDEFVLFIADQPEQAVAQGLACLEQAQKEYCKTHGLELSLAVGLDRFRFGGADTVHDLVCRADAQMYAHKRRWKKAHNEAGAR